MGVLSGTDCRDCGAGRPHCHGTLIRHPDGHWQCTESDCSSPELLLHTFLVDCEAVGCGCAGHNAGQDGQRLAV